MVVFAIAHSYTFTYKEYMPERFQNIPEGQAVPRTLARPMRPQDALWSSTVPKETLSDIHRMRHGVVRVMSDHSNPSPGSISLKQVVGSYEIASSDDEIDDEADEERSTTNVV
jgi:hypothetical protein